MSHFVGFVVVPPKTENIEESVTNAVALYSENDEVPEYTRKCYCVGVAADRESWEQAEGECGTIESFRVSFKGDRDDDAAWRKHIAPLKDRHKELVANHPRNGTPKEDCSECSGTGITTTTYNPLSKWDWWVIGGRWSGHLMGGDTSTVKSLPLETADDWLPFVFVDSKGDWHERGRMGWFGITSDEKDVADWRSAVLGLIANEDPEAIVVAVDFHI